MWRLGVDIGGVIIERAESDSDTSFFGDDFLRTPPVPGAFEALAALFDGLFAGQVQVVSKCSERVERRSRQWLAHQDFHRRTGIGPERLHFCRTRPEKAPIAERLGLTHFVDDSPEVLGHLALLRRRYLFRPEAGGAGVAEAPPAGVHLVRSWSELLAALADEAGSDGAARG